VVPPWGRGRRREYGGKGAEEDEREAMRRRKKREAARGEEREGAQRELHCRVFAISVSSSLASPKVSHELLQLSIILSYD
jgi:hypothetical protein